MANLSLKNIPDHVHRKLKLRARQNHRSLNGELLAILENAVEQQAPGNDLPDTFARLRALRAACEGGLSLRETQRTIDEGRP